MEEKKNAEGRWNKIFFWGGGEEDQRRKRMKIIMDKEKLLRTSGRTDLVGFARDPRETKQFQHCSQHPHSHTSA